MESKYDAIIIGTGQSGPSLAGRLAKEGMQVAVIERHLFGGTCVNTGCIPTKTFVEKGSRLIQREDEDVSKTVPGILVRAVSATGFPPTLCTSIRRWDELG
jgi:pyruvate/2-oxoglutarate dehydrogenase complex dihydrolipoamide dehydrogenase (E3) component